MIYDGPYEHLTNKDGPHKYVPREAGYIPVPKPTVESLPQATTAFVMINEDPKAYCLMASFKTEAEALEVLKLVHSRSSR